MSKPIDRVELITGIQRRRRYTAEEKVRLVEQTMQPGMMVSAVARLHGVAPSLLFQWGRRMTEGGQKTFRADEEVVPLSRVRELEGRVRELERPLGRKTMETEIMREALEAARPKNTGSTCRRRLGTLPSEGCGNNAWRGQVQSGRASPASRASAAWPLTACRD
jgi:transposase